MFYGCIHLTSVLEYPKENNIIEANNIYPIKNLESSLNEETESNIIYETDNSNLYCLAD